MVWCCSCNLLVRAHAHLSLRAELHVLHPLTIALELSQCLTLHPLVELHGLLQGLDPPLQVHLIADLRLVLQQKRRVQLGLNGHSALGLTAFYHKLK